MLAALGTIWAGAWLLATAPADASFLSPLTAVVAVALLAALTARAVRRAAAVAGSAYLPVAVPASSTERNATVPRLCDPDAAGRPRPRAPSADRAG